jgi:hypothetical protein
MYFADSSKVFSFEVMMLNGFEGHAVLSPAYDTEAYQWFGSANLLLLGVEPFWTERIGDG